MERPVWFEWDAAKAERNLEKHRVSFEYATLVFADPRHGVVATARVEDGESRCKAIGMIAGRVFTVVFVMRGETCRLISARRSNKGEEQHYASRED